MLRAKQFVSKTFTLIIKVILYLVHSIEIQKLKVKFIILKSEYFEKSIFTDGIRILYLFKINESK